MKREPSVICHLVLGTLASVNFETFVLAVLGLTLHCGMQTQLHACGI